MRWKPTNCQTSIQTFQAEPDFLCAAHRFRWAAAIFARVAADTVGRLFGVADWGDGVCGRRPLRFAGSDPEEMMTIAVRAR